jgi:phenylacetate-CoA ligase
MSSEVTRRVFYPVLQRRWHPFAFDYLGEFQKHEFAPLEAIQKTQWLKLSHLVQHAFEHVPYYGKLFKSQDIHPEDIHTADDFARIPILTKEMIRTCGREMLAEDMDPSRFQPNASGGSTGKPLQFFQDERYWDYAWASQWFVESWWGIRPGDRTASVWGTDRDLPELTWRERLGQKICQVRICNAFALSDRELQRFAEGLVRWQPRFLIGYASALGLFARFLLDHPQLGIRPQAVKSTAEVLTPADRAAIQEAFKCPVYDFYGSREVNNLAAECPAHQGLHINALARWIEIVDDCGRPVPPGVAGRILVTDLTNLCMPFIRYEIEDLGTWSSESCDCGRPFSLLASILGRRSDFIATPSGKIIHGEFFTHIFYPLTQVKQFQFVQHSLDHVRVEVVTPGESASALLRTLKSRIQEVLGEEVKVEIRVVDKIERPLSGKHRFTISSVEIPWGPRTTAAVPAIKRDEVAPR